MLKTILVHPLFNILLLIYAVLPGHDFGLAVIGLTILIRLSMWPLVQKQLHHQKAMKELQPQIAAMKKKAGGNRQKESQLMVELFKQNQVNPFASLGLALLQFPILIALFFVLRDVVEGGKIESVAYSFVASLEPIRAIISNPGSFDPTFLGLVHMAEPNLVLAVLAGITQYFQAKQLTPAKPAKGSPGSSLTSNMLLIFPVVTVAIAATLPSALALYWVTSSLVAIGQQHLVLAEEVSFMRKLKIPSVRKS